MLGFPEDGDEPDKCQESGEDGFGLEVPSPRPTGVDEAQDGDEGEADDLHRLEGERRALLVVIQPFPHVGGSSKGARHGTLTYTRTSTTAWEEVGVARSPSWERCETLWGLPPYEALPRALP